MTQEEKLLQLLQIAVENGWEDITRGCHFLLPETLLLWNHCGYEDSETYSLDQLVGQWEDGEVSFIGALVLADTISAVNYTYNFEIIASSDFTDTLNYQWKSDATTAIRLMWMLKPTSQRVNWLFEVFNHLLTQ